MEILDVCIIGGSIAGNYLSYLLSKKNLKIAIIEEHEEMGLPFQCAGIISKKLKKLIIFYPKAFETDYFRNSSKRSACVNVL